MNVSSNSGIAETWTALRMGAVDQAVRLSALKAQLDSQNAVLQLVQETVAAAPSPPPAGQGEQVDLRA